MQHWHEVEDWLRNCAHADVVEFGAIRPTLVAFVGTRPLLIARWRPFGPSGGHAALTELLALAIPLGADRLAVSIGGNARSYRQHGRAPTDDDAREILLIAITDDIAAGSRPRCTLMPFDHSGNDVLWGCPIVTDAVEGWLARTLAAPLEAVAATAANPDDIAAAALRCLALGHELHIAVTPR